ncbi:hypothetical protein D3C80_1480680 [compost metagenome]
MIIMQAKQEFHCSVLGLQLRNFSQGVDSELFIQLCTQRLGQVAHRFKIINPLDVEPVKDLSPAESRFSVVLCPLLQFFQSKIIY